MSLRRQADHPFLTALVAGLVFSALWVALNRGDEPGWLLVTAIGWWVLGYPALNAWLWREGGGRRTRYDQRVRVSRGGAARLGG